MFKRATFRSKIILFIAPVFVLLCVLMLIVYSSVSTDIIEDLTLESMDTELTILGQSIDKIFEKTYFSLSSLRLNSEFIEMLSKSYEYGSYEFFLASKAIQSKLTEVVRENEYIESIYVYNTVNGYFFADDTEVFYFKESIENTDWYELLQGIKNSQWSYFQEKTDSVLTSSKYLALFSPIFSQFTGQEVALLSINLSHENIIDNVIGFEESTSKFYSVDDNQNVIISTDTNIITQKANFFSRGVSASFFGDSSYVVTAPSNLHGMQGFLHVIETPQDEVFERFQVVDRFFYICIFLATFLIVAYSLFISKIIYRPIKALVQHMTDVETINKNDEVSNEENDDFDKLHKNFNAMVKDLNIYEKENSSQNVLIQSLRAQTLKAQLSPHFLYNALDSIHWAVRENEINDACKMIWYLSDFFRTTLVGGHDIVSVAQASAIVESYLKFQLIRHEHKCEIYVHVQDEVRHFSVLKHLFQPLVENAFTHGLKEKLRGGKITVEFLLGDSDDELYFYVQDNGAGIAQDRLMYVRQALESATFVDVEDCLALKNVQLQLKLYYNDAKLIIDSVPNEGTKISFRIKV